MLNVALDTVLPLVSRNVRRGGDFGTPNRVFVAQPIE